MTAFGAAAAQHCSPCLGLHAGKEAMGLGAVTAIRLKGTLGMERTPETLSKI